MQLLGCYGWCPGWCSVVPIGLLGCCDVLGDFQCVGKQLLGCFQGVAMQLLGCF